MQSHGTANDGYNYVFIMHMQVSELFYFHLHNVTPKSIAQGKGFGPPSCYTNNAYQQNNMLQSRT